MKSNRWASVASRGVLFATIWWILTAGDAASWLIGVPAIILAVVTSMALVPATPFVWSALLRFAPFFILRSLLGGIDVAWRAYHPKLPIAPDLVSYTMRLPVGLPRVFMANTVSLLPGALSASLDQAVLTVHVLDARTDYLAELKAVEESVARIFGVSTLSLQQGDG